MSRDYAYKVPKRKTKKTATNNFSGKFLVITFLLLSCFAAVLFYLHQQGRLDSLTQFAMNQTKPHAANKATKQKPVERKASAPRFEFYTLLPKMDVPVSTKENEKEESNKAAQQTTIVEEDANTPATKEASAEAARKMLGEPAEKIEKVENQNQNIAPVVEAQAKEIEKSNKKEQPPKVASVYTLQLGAFKSSADADRFKAELLLLGFDVAVQKIARENTFWYHVRLGPFNSAAAAEAAKKELLENNYRGVVKRIS